MRIRITESQRKLLMENSVDTNTPFNDLDKGDVVEIYSFSGKKLKDLIVHDVGRYVMFNDKSSSNYMIVSLSETINDGELKYIENPSDNPSAMNSKTLFDVGVILVYDTDGGIKAKAISDKKREEVTNKKNTKQVVQGIREKAKEYGYEVGDRFKLYTCDENGTKEHDLEIVDIPSMHSDVYMALSGDLGDIDIEWIHIEDWVENSGVMPYKKDDANFKLSNIIRLRSYDSSSELKIDIPNVQKTKECEEFKKNKVKREKYEFIHNELLTALSNTGYVTITTDDGNDTLINVNEINDGIIDITIIGGDIDDDLKNTKIKVRVDDDNPKIVEKSDSYSVEFKLGDRLLLSDIINVEYSEADSKMSGPEMLNMILSDPLLRKAFYDQPKLLGFIRSGDPQGMSVAHRVLSKYINHKSDSDIDKSWKDKFKTNKIAEIILLSDVDVIKTDTRKRVRMASEYERLTGSIRRSGDAKEVHIRLKNKDGKSFDVQVMNEVSPNIYEISVYMLDGSTITSYESKGNIKVSDYNKIG